MIKIFLLSSDKQGSRNAMMNVGSLIERQNRGVPKYDIRRWDDPGLFKPGDTRFHSIINVAKDVDGAIVVFGQDDQTSDKESLLIQYGLLVGILDHHRAIICRAGNAASASELDGIYKIEFSSGNINTAEGNILVWLEKLDKQEIKLNTEEISVLALIKERAFTHGYTTLQMVERHLIGKILTSGSINDLLLLIEEKKLIRRERINDIWTFFITDSGQKYVKSNPNLFSEKALELGLVDKEKGEIGTNK